MDTQNKAETIRSLFTGKPKLGFTINELCESTGFGRSQIYKDIKAKKLKPKKNGKRTIIPFLEAVRYMEDLDDMEAD